MNASAEQQKAMTGLWDLLTGFVKDNPGCPERVIVMALRVLSPATKEENIQLMLAGWLLTDAVVKRDGRYYVKGEA